MIESPKRPARPPSDEDEDDDEDSSERPKVNRKEPMLRKGGFNRHSLEVNSLLKVLYYV